jgi:hypothetical protein
MKVNARLSNKGQSSGILSLLSVIFVLILFLITDIYLGLEGRRGAKMVLKYSSALEPLILSIVMPCSSTKY